jgi:hypothetical protein
MLRIGSLVPYKSLVFFQANQKDLETATETLSEYLERDISAENLVDIKQKVQDKYRCAVESLSKLWGL